MSLLKKPGLEYKSQSAGNTTKLRDNEDRQMMSQMQVCQLGGQIH